MPPISAETERQLRWAARVWWMNLNGISPDDGTVGRTDRQAIAELRRVGAVATPDGVGIDLVKAYASRPFHHLLTLTAKFAPLNTAQVALAAAALSHVRRDTTPNKDQPWLSTATLLGQGTPPVFSELRFRRLLRTSATGELLPQIVRAIRILGAAAPVGELGASLLLWGPRVKRRWAFAYWRRPGADADPEDTLTGAAASSTCN